MNKHSELNPFSVIIILVLAILMTSCGAGGSSPASEKKAIDAISNETGIDRSILEKEFVDYEVLTTDDSTRYRSRQTLQGYEVYGSELNAIVDEDGNVIGTSGKYYNDLESMPGFDDLIKDLESAPAEPEFISLFAENGFDVDHDNVEKLIICDDSSVTYGYRLDASYEGMVYTFVITADGYIVDLLTASSYYAFSPDKSSPTNVQHPLTGENVEMSEYKGSTYAYNAAHDFYITIRNNAEVKEHSYKSNLEKIYTTNDWSNRNNSLRVITAASNIEKICKFWNEKICDTSSRGRIEISIITDISSTKILPPPPNVAACSTNDAASGIVMKYRIISGCVTVTGPLKSQVGTTIYFKKVVYRSNCKGFRLSDAS